jgi:hypothetical protein
MPLCLELPRHICGVASPASEGRIRSSNATATFRPPTPAACQPTAATQHLKLTNNINMPTKTNVPDTSFTGGDIRPVPPSISATGGTVTVGRGTGEPGGTGLVRPDAQPPSPPTPVASGRPNFKVAGPVLAQRITDHLNAGTPNPWQAAISDHQDFAKSQSQPAQ